MAQSDKDKNDALKMLNGSARRAPSCHFIPILFPYIFPLFASNEDRTKSNNKNGDSGGNGDSGANGDNDTDNGDIGAIGTTVVNADNSV